jgi:5-methyltetrahydrofolate--homocysteine methyltransferase
MGRTRVLGDIGPCGDFLEPMGDLDPETLACAIREQAHVLATGGVDGFVVETMSDPGEVTIAVATLKAYFGLPVIATYTFEKGPQGFQTMMGTTPAQAARAAIEAGADAVGANCGTSLSLADYLSLGQQLIDASEGVPTVLQPNAGTPDASAEGYQYGVTPQQFGEWGVSARKIGIKIIGGCCGTTPKHIEALDAAFAFG